MHCPDLVRIFDLIRYYTPYDTNPKIAERLGLHRTNIKKYLYDHEHAPYIPARQHHVFQDFLSEIFPQPVTLERTRELLSGDAEAFRMQLFPASGRHWERLIGLHSHFSKMSVFEKLPQPLDLGVSSLVFERQSDAEISIGKYFRFSADLPFSGQAILLAELEGVWHLIKPNGTDVVLNTVERRLLLPQAQQGNPVYLVERGPVGFYRYYLIVKRGTFSREERERIHALDTSSLSELDGLAVQLLEGQKFLSVHEVSVTVVDLAQPIRTSTS